MGELSLDNSIPANKWKKKGLFLFLKSNELMDPGIKH